MHKNNQLGRGFVFSCCVKGKQCPLLAFCLTWLSQCVLA